MPTPNWILPDETGATLSTNGGGLCNTIGGSPAIQSTTKHTGAYALQLLVSGAGASCYIRKNLWTTGNTNVAGSFWIYWHTWPSATAQFISVSVNAGVSGQLRVKTDGKVEAYFSGGSTGTSANALSLDTWYRVAVRWDYSGSTSYIYVSIYDSSNNLIESIQGSIVQTATYAGYLQLGWGNSVTGEAYIDDAVTTSTGSDHPLPDYRVEKLSPTSDGTHNAGTNVIEDNAGTDIGATTAYDKINSIPPSATTYIRQAANGTGNYAEVQYENLATSHSAIGGAMAVLAYTSETTTANKGICIASKDDFSTSSTIWGEVGATADYSDGSTGNLHFKNAMISGVVDDTTANALEARVGGSDDANPDPYWIDVVVVVAYVTSTTQTYHFITNIQATSSQTAVGKNSIKFTANVQATSSTTSVGKLTVTFAANIQATSSLTVIGIAAKIFTANVQATSSTTTVGVVEIIFATSILPTSSVVAVGKNGIHFATAIAATSSLTVVGSVAKIFTTNVQATSSLIIVGTIAFTISFTANVQATSGSTTLGIIVVPFTVNISATSSALCIGTKILVFVTDVQATSSLVGVGRLTIIFAGDLQATSSLVVVGQIAGQIVFTANMLATSSMVAIAKSLMPFNSNILGTSSLAVVGNRALHLLANIQSTSTATIQALVILVATVTINATSSLTANGFVPSLITIVHLHSESRVADFNAQERIVNLNTNHRIIEMEVPR